MVIPVLTYPDPQGYLGLLFLIITAVVFRIKIKKVKRIAYILSNGILTEAEITCISDTEIEISDRTVKSYNFQYTANGKRFNYEHQSANLRHLDIGSKLSMYYLASHPKVIAIPSFYNLNL